MKKITSLLLIGILFISLCVFIAPVSADIIDVYSDQSIQAAINSATSGDTIHVHEGTYTECIELKNGVSLVGGFDGTTTIDGNSSGRVVDANNVTSTTQFSGFTIINGLSNNGGGMFINNSSSDFIITNCTFSNNTAVYYGAGMYLNNSSPTITNCTFSNNTAATDPNGKGGAGVYIEYQSSPTITNCTFNNNTATNGRGGGIHVVEYSSPTITNCTFGENTALAGYGGGIYIWYNSSVSIEGCEFSDNEASYGGGIYMDTYDYIGFHNYVYPSSIDIDDCLFDSNETGSSGYGGAIYLEIISPQTSPISISNSIMKNNSAGECGGAIYCYGEKDTSFIIEKCSFEKNLVNEGYYNYGGALCLENISTTIMNCVFFENDGDDRGGAIYLYEVPSSYIYNNTFYNNVVSPDTSTYFTSDLGYGIYAYYSDSIIKNCILWDDVDSEIYSDNSNVTVSFSDIIDTSYYEDLDLDPATVDDKNNNIFEGPSFINSAIGDLHLKSDSPCIDAGTNITEVTDDIDGHPRPLGEYDIGADEYKVSDADLSVTKTVSTPWCYPSSYVQFTITVTNNGPGDATGVEVADIIPFGLNYQYSTPSKGTYDGETWDIGNLDNGDQETLTIVVRTNARGLFVNTATVSGTEEDPVAGNNVDQAAVYVLNRRTISLISIVSINQRNADLLFGDVLENLPEIISPEVQGLLDDVQAHMTNASTLTNPIYSNGELVKAIGLMEDINEINGF